MVVKDGGPLIRSLIERIFNRHQYTRDKIFAEGQGSSLHVGGVNVSGLQILGAEPLSGGCAAFSRQRRNSAERFRRDCNYVADD